MSQHSHAQQREHVTLRMTLSRVLTSMNTYDDALMGPYLHEHAESSFKEISEA